MSWPLVMVIALALDAVLGWPAPLYARIGHPVTWLGRLIAALEQRLNRAPYPRMLTGALTTALTVAVAAGLAWLLGALLPDGWLGTLIAGVLAWPLVAARSMYTHVADVARPLEQGDLTGARGAVAMIVGRDPAALDQAGVSRATLESLAENSSDGIVAPLFWGALLGLPGIAGYKAINTLDSMIGHRNDRYEAFGKTAARIDDLVNLIPARLTGVLFALTTARPRAASQVMWRDAGHHRSPNAGWPEAALAGALDRRLSGPRSYGDRITDEPWVNAGHPDPDASDIWRGLRAYTRMLVAFAGLLLLWAAV